MIVNRIKNNDTSKLDEYVEIPEVVIDDTTDKKTLEIVSFGIIKK